MSATITPTPSMASAAAGASGPPMHSIPASVASLLSEIPPAVLSSLTASGLSPAVTSALAEGHLPPGFCLDPPPKASKVDLPGTSVTLHELFLILGGIFMGFTVLGCTIIWLSHLMYRATYREQSILMRITILPLIYAVLSFVSIWSYGVGGIVNPISKLYVAYCVTSYFNYMVEVVIPHHDHAQREDFFIMSERRRFFGRDTKHGQGSLRWWRFNAVICYIALFVNLVVFILTEVVSQTMCKTSTAYANVILVANVINAVFTILGLAALPRMWWRFREDHYARTHVLRRFATFKPYVALIVMQSFIMGILDYVEVVDPTPYMTRQDFLVGIPGFMITCWSFIFVWGFVYTLSGRTYREHPTKDGQPVWKYIWYFMFPRDVFVGAWISTLYFLSLLGKPFDYTGGTGMGWIERQPTHEGTAEPVDEKKGTSVENVVEERRRTMMSDSDADSGDNKDKDDDQDAINMA